jgi:hypothetical protein
MISIKYRYVQYSNEVLNHFGVKNLSSHLYHRMINVIEYCASTHEYSSNVISRKMHVLECTI